MLGKGYHMQFSINLTITPLTLKEFEHKYGTSKLDYKKYLEANIERHHYTPFENMLEWYKYQCTLRN